MEKESDGSFLFKYVKIKDIKDAKLTLNIDEEIMKIKTIGKLGSEVFLH